MAHEHLQSVPLAHGHLHLQVSNFTMLCQHVMIQRLQFSIEQEKELSIAGQPSIALTVQMAKVAQQGCDGDQVLGLLGGGEDASGVVEGFIMINTW